MRYAMIRSLSLVATLLAASVAPARAQVSEQVTGDLNILGNLNLRDFAIRGGGVLEIPDQVRLQRGGTSDPLPPTSGLVRAQPGGNFEILPLGDYYRSALDIYPTMGKKPDMDALAELTIHRIMPSNDGHEMLSISGLADSQSRFGVIVEAHGTGRVKPLDFQMIQGGLLDVDKAVVPFYAIAMRMKTDGTMQFSPLRSEGSQAPVDAISIERDNPGADGNFPSDYLRFTAKRMGSAGSQSDWRTSVQVAGAQGSTLTIENREAGGDYQTKLKVTDSGDVELATPGAGVVLKSPNGKRWRLSITDEGSVRVDEAPE